MKFNRVLNRLYWSEISDPHEYFGSKIYWRIHHCRIKFNIKTIARFKHHIDTVPFRLKRKNIRPFSKKRINYPMWFGFYKPEIQQELYGDVCL